ncbi:MAG: 4Fe-4S dicluster domain-containing protein [Chloroflexi bacterium]|nr:4Fe-4S dicluster domain-containing protein [Chloroflexota bacterium]
METLPYRVGWWNIPVSLRVVFFAVMAVAVAVMAYGIVQRVKLWRRGQPQAGFDRLGARVARTLRYGVAQVRVLRERYPAFLHLGIFWGMALLFLGTVLASLDTDVFELIFDAKLLKGDLYLVYKVVLDLAALFVLAGLGLAIYRRYVVKPERLRVEELGVFGAWRFHLTLSLLAFIVLSGLLVESLRLAATRPAWAPFSIVGYPLSLLLVGLGEPVLLGLHRSLWIVHFIAVAGLFAVLPWTNLLHVVTSPANIFFAPFKLRGALMPIPNLEQAETLGVSKVAEFPWPRLVNVDACTECGRCQDVCPAHSAKKPLSPKRLVLDLRAAMSPPRPATAAHPPLIGGVIQHDTLWACTTCYACVQECPVLIEQVDDIVDMRRYLALAEGNLPASLATTLTNIERAGNPWKQSRRKRTAWTQGLDFEVPLMANVGEADVLWWVGCAGAYDPRNQKVTRAVANILHAAGVNFAILGEEEQCTGDAARRSGNEYLFQTLAQANLEILNRYKFKLILTQCPHCFNTLLNEYPQFGGRYQVMSHTTYIEALLAEGQVKVKAEAKAEVEVKAKGVTFHDPCYLGRYNDEYEAPRYLVRATGRSLVEMQRARDRAMCCGGGGARVWMEDEGETRVNYSRLAQIVATGASEVGVACPFCLLMLEDARGAQGAEQLVIRDVAEMVAERMAGK